MKRKIIMFATIFALAIMLTASYINFYVLTQPEQRGQRDPFLPLIPPPASATDYGNPLNTTTMGLVAYYNNPSGWILNKTVPIFINYTDHGSYYDGFVRIWQDATGNNYQSSDPANYPYIDIGMRIRSDGWVIAFTSRADADKANYIYWGRKPLFGSLTNAPSTYSTTGAPITNATTPARAIEYLYYASGGSFPTYASINLYDYQYPTASKLVLFGRLAPNAGNNVPTYYTFYSLFPSSTNTAVIKSWASYNSMIYTYNGQANVTMTVTTGSTTTQIVTDYLNTGGQTYGGQMKWTSYDLSSYVSLDLTTKWTLYEWNSFGSSASSQGQVAIMVWLS